MLRAIARKNNGRVMDVWRTRTKGICVATLLCGTLGLSVETWGDLSKGTPLFACTPPTEGLNDNGTTYTLPTTGVQALKEIRFYLDPPALVTGPNCTPTGSLCRIPANVIAKKVVPMPGACTWQTAVGDIGSGAHTVRATAVDNSGAESDASNALSFTVPAAKPVGPIAPSGITVQ